MLLSLLLAACGQIDQAGVALVGPALSPAPPTATPRPVTPTAAPAAYPLPEPIPGDRAALTPENIPALGALAALPGGIGPLSRLAFDRTGERLAAADDRGAVQLWNIPASTVQLMTAATDGITPTPFSLRSSPPGRVPYGALAFSPAGDRVLVLGEDFVRSWAVADNTLLAESRLRDGASFNPNGSVALHSGEDALLMARGGMKDGVNNYRVGLGRLWDLSAEGEPVDLEGHTGWVTALAFSPAGDRLATTSTDHRLLLWDLQTRTLALEIDSLTRRPNQLLFDPAGERIACADQEGVLRLWDARDGALRGEFSAGGPIYAIAFSPDGRLVAAALEDGTLQVWEAGQGALLATLTAGDDTASPRPEDAPAPAVAFSPDGTLLASLDRANVVHLWGVLP